MKSAALYGSSGPLPADAGLVGRKHGVGDGVGMGSAALRRAASVYLATTGWQGEVQFDLAAVTVATDGATDVRLIENAMECHW